MPNTLKVCVSSTTQTSLSGASIPLRLWRRLPPFWRWWVNLLGRSIFTSQKKSMTFLFSPPEISMTQHASSRHRMDAPDHCKRAKLFPSNVSLYVGPDRYRPTIGLMQGSRLQSNVNQQQNVDWNRDELYTNCICHYHWKWWWAWGIWIIGRCRTTSPEIWINRAFVKPMRALDELSSFTNLCYDLWRSWLLAVTSCSQL